MKIEHNNSFRSFKDLTDLIVDFSGKDYASYFGCALAGEVGELCNIIKKLERDGIDETHKQLISKERPMYLKHLDSQKYLKNLIALELADVFIYTELTARFFGINLEEAIYDKLSKLEKRLPHKKHKQLIVDDLGEVDDKYWKTSFASCARMSEEE